MKTNILSNTLLSIIALILVWQFCIGPAIDDFRGGREAAKQIQLLMPTDDDFKNNGGSIEDNMRSAYLKMEALNSYLQSLKYNVRQKALRRYWKENHVDPEMVDIQTRLYLK